MRRELTGKILQDHLARLGEAEASLVAAGAVLRHRSEGDSRSSYWGLRLAGRASEFVVRVSDHYLPEREERVSGSMGGADEEIVVDFLSRPGKGAESVAEILADLR